MSLTKQDLKEIKGVVGEALEENFPRLFEKTIEPLAASIQKDFADVKGDLKGIKQDIIDIKDDINYIHSRFDVLERETADIKKKYV